MPWGVAAAAVGAYGSMKASKNNKEAAEAGATTKNQIDPRLAALLYGEDEEGSTGIAQLIAQQAQQGQSGGLLNFGKQQDMYLGSYGQDGFNRSQQNAQRLQEMQNGAPQVSNVRGVNVAGAQAANVNAPRQNSMDLSGAYNGFINGDAGANPYLNRALQSGVDMTNTSFQKNAGYAKDSLDNSLAGIRGNSVLAGQYGSSRQGVAEGNALKSYTDQLNNANLQLAQTNSANTTGAQAQAFNQGQDRSLAALQGLSAQQYGVAGQNASNMQQTNLANLGANLAQSTTNANLQQGVNLANQQAQMSTTAQNDARNISGVGLSSGLLGQAYGYAQGGQNADYERLLRGAGLLGGLAGNNTSTTTAPSYSNTGANLLGGAAAGLGLYNQFNQSQNTGGGGFNSWNTMTM